MREIFVNGVSFRYKTERDLGLILLHFTETARVKAVLKERESVERRREIPKEIKSAAERA